MATRTLAEQIADRITACMGRQGIARLGGALSEQARIIIDAKHRRVDVTAGNAVPSVCSLAVGLIADDADAATPLVHPGLVAAGDSWLITG